MRFILCRKLVLCGPRVITVCALFGRPRVLFLFVSPGDNEHVLSGFACFYHRGWLPVVGWYARERAYRTSNKVV